MYFKASKEDQMSEKRRQRAGGATPYMSSLYVTLCLQCGDEFTFPTLRGPYGAPLISVV